MRACRTREAFAANAFFSAGQVMFEIPTGVIADTRGRRFSFLLGAATLLLATLLYLYMWQTEAPFVGWALASILLGLGFTFFSGATEAWLVDALVGHRLYRKPRVGVRPGAGGRRGGDARGLRDGRGRRPAHEPRRAVPAAGCVPGGHARRCLPLHARHRVHAGPRREPGQGRAHGARTARVDGGLRNPPVRWLMLAAPFTTGVGFYVFYAIQPYLLQLYGDPNAYSVAGLAAALFAGVSMIGGLLVPWARRLFRRRTTALLLGLLADIVILVLIGVSSSFVFVIAVLTISSILSSIERPLRQSFINGVIPSAQRATVLSFDSLMGSAGGVVIQPVLGRAADVYGYGASYVIAAGIETLAIPFVFLARRERAPSDPIVVEGRPATA